MRHARVKINAHTLPEQIISHHQVALMPGAEIVFGRHDRPDIDTAPPRPCHCHEQVIVEEISIFHVDITGSTVDGCKLSLPNLAMEGFGVQPPKFNQWNI